MGKVAEKAVANCRKVAEKAAAKQAAAKQADDKLATKQMDDKTVGQQSARNTTTAKGSTAAKSSTIAKQSITSRKSPMEVITEHSTTESVNEPTTTDTEKGGDTEKSEERTGIVKPENIEDYTDIEKGEENDNGTDIEKAQDNESGTDIERAERNRLESAVQDAKDALLQNVGEYSVSQVQRESPKIYKSINDVSTVVNKTRTTSLNLIPPANTVNGYFGGAYNAYNPCAATLSKDSQDSMSSKEGGCCSCFAERKAGNKNNNEEEGESKPFWDSSDVGETKKPTRMSGMQIAGIQVAGLQQSYVTKNATSYGKPPRSFSDIQQSPFFETEHTLSSVSPAQAPKTYGSLIHETKRSER